MAISCEPADLTAAAKCYCYSDQRQIDSVLTYLLAQLASDTSTPDELAAKAKCYCFDPKTRDAAITYLLCQIANSGSAPAAPCTFLEGAGDPTGSQTPEFIGQLYHDTGADTYYRSTGLTNADWTLISGGTCIMSTTPPGNEERFGIMAFGDITAATALVWNGTTTEAGFDIEYDSSLVSISFPNLTSVDPLNIQNGYFKFSNNSSLTTISAPNLTALGFGGIIAGNASLTTVSLPLLATSSNSGFQCVSNAALLSFSLPSLTTSANLDVRNHTNLTTCSLPLLTQLPNLNCYTNAALTTLNLNALTTVTAWLNIYDNPVLASISCPSLVTADSISCAGDTLLTSFSAPVWVPTNGSTIDFTLCALTDTSVNHILARCVANAGFVSGSVDLSGGTSAAPSGQGIADKATLIGCGVTVTTN